MKKKRTGKPLKIHRARRPGQPHVQKTQRAGLMVIAKGRRRGLAVIMKSLIRVRGKVLLMKKKKPGRLWKIRRAHRPGQPHEQKTQRAGLMVTARVRRRGLELKTIPLMAIINKP
jgi:hypothetical protein